MRASWRLRSQSFVLRALALGCCALNARPVGGELKISLTWRSDIKRHASIAIFCAGDATVTLTGGSRLYCGSAAHMRIISQVMVLVFTSGRCAVVCTYSKKAGPDTPAFLASNNLIAAK